MNGPPQLIRGLGPWGGLAMNVANMIGTGVFLKARVMTCNTGSPGLVLLAWLAAGLLCLAGTLAYSELGAMLPEAGGDYVFLRRTYGRLPAFLFGWTMLSVARTGSQAALAVGFAIFLNILLHGALDTPLASAVVFGSTLSLSRLTAVALVTLWATAALSCGHIGASGRVAVALTVLKVGVVLAVGLSAFALANGSAAHFVQPLGTARCEGVAATARGGLAGFSAAMLGALWAYDGWNNVAPLIGEMRDPERNIPRAFVGGTLLVGALYLLANAGYFWVLGPSAVAAVSSSSSVATEVLRQFLGPAAVALMAAALALSSFNALHASTLANSRITFAMARDRLFPAAFAALSARTRAPVRSILIQVAWASVLALSGTFDVLTDCVIFASWLFYGLCGGALFVLRRKMPDAPRPYRAWGYPLIPGLFIGATVALLLGTFVSNPREAFTGAGLMLAGLPLFAWMNRRHRSRAPQ